MGVNAMFATTFMIKGSSTAKDISFRAYSIHTYILTPIIIGYSNVQIVPITLELGVHEGFVSASYHCIVLLFIRSSMSGNAVFSK